MILAALLMSCLLTAVPADLQDAYCRASWAWLPYRAALKSARWCEEGSECLMVRSHGGGVFQSPQIILDTQPVDPQLQSPEYWGMSRDEQLQLILKHEIGHALGLEHSSQGIMREGWDAWVPSNPGAAEFEALRK